MNDIFSLNLIEERGGEMAMAAQVTQSIQQDIFRKLQQKNATATYAYHDGVRVEIQPKVLNTLNLLRFIRAEHRIDEAGLFAYLLPDTESVISGQFADQTQLKPFLEELQSILDLLALIDTSSSFMYNKEVLCYQAIIMKVINIHRQEAELKHLSMLLGEVLTMDFHFSSHLPARVRHWQLQLQHSDQHLMRMATMLAGWPVKHWPIDRQSIWLQRLNTLFQRISASSVADQAQYLHLANIVGGHLWQRALHARSAVQQTTGQKSFNEIANAYYPHAYPHSNKKLRQLIMTDLMAIPTASSHYPTALLAISRTLALAINGEITDVAQKPLTQHLKSALHYAHQHHHTLQIIRVFSMLDRLLTAQQTLQLIYQLYHPRLLAKAIIHHSNQSAAHINHLQIVSLLQLVHAELSDEVYLDQLINHFDAACYYRQIPADSRLYFMMATLVSAPKVKHILGAEYADHKYFCYINDGKLQGDPACTEIYYQLLAQDSFATLDYHPGMQLAPEF